VTEDLGEGDARHLEENLKTIADLRLKLFLTSSKLQEEILEGHGTKTDAYPSKLPGMIGRLGPEIGSLYSGLYPQGSESSVHLL
jgi:hypothetical protein